jgi:hypothetical protein
LSQEQYVLRMLERFSMSHCNRKVVPADPFTNLNAVTFGDGDNSEDFDQPIYREAVGSIMYLMVCTRPDIAYAVGQVAQHCNKPKPAHWMAVRRILAYLRGTSNYGISYSPTASANQLVAYSDSDYAGDTETRRSTTGYLLMCNAGPLTWASRRQQCVSLSTTEAEYIAMCETTKEITWMRRLLRSIGSDQSPPTLLRCDNQGAIKLVSNPEFDRRTKHIDVKYHYVRDQHQDGIIEVDYVGTKEQLADKTIGRTGVSRFTRSNWSPRYLRLSGDVELSLSNFKPSGIAG